MANYSFRFPSQRQVESSPDWHSWSERMALLGIHDRPGTHEIGPAAYGFSPAAMREQANQPAPPTAFEILMEQLGNPLAGPSVTQGMRRQAVQSSPYTAAIQEIRRQIAQTGAQTQQNIADIGSWFGQYRGVAKKSAKGNRRAGKAAVKENRQTLGGLLSSGLVGDPSIRGQLAGASADEERYLRSSNLATGNLDRQMIADAARQQSYQALVQSRLGAQAQADLRSKIPGLQQQRSASVQEAMSSMEDDRFSQWATIMGMIPQDERAELLGFPQQDEEEDPFKWRDRLGEAMGGVSPVYQSKNESGDNVTRPSFSNFNELLDAYKSAVSGSGLDIDNPDVRDAFRKYLAAYVLNQWNPAAAASGLKPMTLAPGGQQFIPR